ncbi:Rad9-domain-containing protein [Leucosporidium creatinivorum]|uniref:Rad9-domain-containing protein n=1 Tax=Leucosporidium creatinivorum TaxID=106004 RepID=A0A1Y2FVG9_9BASI|nr:Rad9-domain-containing protein [Leucosporidium creatinivorum]
MELVIPAGTPLKNFTRSLACLTKFGQDLDFSCSRTQLKLSSVNPSRSAFALIDFKPAFFSRYDVDPPKDGRGVISFCVTAKALLSPLRPRSANTIESVTISLEDGGAAHGDESGGADTGECRLVVRLYCQHGVVKTHRLTYGNSSSLYAKANRTTCSSFWIASSRVLKDWIDHFHLRTSGGASGGGTDEISFYHGEASCRLKSFGGDINPGDALSSRPVGTELTIDIEDFDKYDVEGSPVITFALKEFKAIITLSDSLVSTLDVAFTTGGSPLIIQTEGEDFIADFVIATTDFDPGDGTPSGGARVKKEGSEQASGVLGRRGSSLAQQKSGTGAESMMRGGSGSTATGSRAPRSETGSNANAQAGPSRPRQQPQQQQQRPNQPLFNPPSPSQNRPQPDEDEEDDEFGDAALDDFDEGAFAEIDRMSQMVPQGAGGGSQVQRPPRGETLVPDTSVVGEASGEGLVSRAASLGLGPTQGGEGTLEENELEGRRKKAKWNLFD